MVPPSPVSAPPPVVLPLPPPPFPELALPAPLPPLGPLGPLGAPSRDSMVPVHASVRAKADAAHDVFQHCSRVVEGLT